MHEELKHQNDGMVAYEWQLDVGEALKLGLDCSVIAGMGVGKAISFILLLLAEKKMAVIIISPLNALEGDQVVNNSLVKIFISYSSYFDMNWDISKVFFIISGQKSIYIIILFFRIFFRGLRS